MADYACDTEDGNQAALSVTSFANAETQFLCGWCFAALGLAMAGEIAPDLLIQAADGLRPTQAVEAKPPAESKRTPKARAKAAVQAAGGDFAETASEVPDA